MYEWKYLYSNILFLLVSCLLILGDFNNIKGKSFENETEFQKEQNAILNSKHIKPNEYKLKKFGFNTQKDFTYYVDYTIKQLKKGRLDLNKYQIFTLRANSPFIFKPLVGCPKNKFGIVLLHDLGESTYQTQHLAHIFKDACILTYSVLLLGHGTRPSDLLGVSYLEWMKQLDYAVKDIKKKVERVYLAGIGVGGSLVLNYALNEQNNISGLFLFSPIIHYQNWNNVFISKLALNTNTWSKLNPNLNRVAYDNIPYNSYHELSKLAHLLQKKLKQQTLNIPTFTVWSKEDELLDFTNSLQLLSQAIPQELSHMIVYYGINNQQSIKLPTKVEWINIYSPEDLIYDFNRKGLVIPSYDWWYGQYPVYQACNHYFNEDSLKEHQLCINEKSTFMGVPSKANLKRGIVRLSTYNPKFYHLHDSLKSFIQKFVFEQISQDHNPDNVE